MIQINSRHKFLSGFLGTKPEEDISYTKAKEVNLWFTLTTCVCCVLEIVLYFVYNRMVNNQKRCYRTFSCSLLVTTAPFELLKRIQVKSIRICYNSIFRSIRGCQ